MPLYTKGRVRTMSASISAEYYIGANGKAGNDSVLLSISFAQSAITCMGASCPASVGAMTGGLTSFTIVPQKGKNGVVAIRLFRESAGRYEPDEDLFFLLPVTYDEKPFVDRKNPLIPSADHLAQLTRDGLFVTAGDQKFAALNTAYHKSSSVAEIKMAWAKQGIRIVPDANLLCRFLVDEATLEQVEAAAEALEQEQAWPAERALLQKRFEERCQQIREQAALDAQVLVNDKVVAETFRLTVVANRINTLRITLARIILAANSARLGNRSEALKEIAKKCQTLLATPQ